MKRPAKTDKQKDRQTDSKIDKQANTQMQDSQTVSILFMGGETHGCKGKQR